MERDRVGGKGRGGAWTEEMGREAMRQRGGGREEVHDAQDSRWKVLCLIDLDNQDSVLINFTNR